MENRPIQNDYYNIFMTICVALHLVHWHWNYLEIIIIAPPSTLAQACRSTKLKKNGLNIVLLLCKKVIVYVEYCGDTKN